MRQGCSNANSLAGVTGYSVIRTPNGASAFSTAEMIAPAAGTQPDFADALDAQRIERRGDTRANLTSILGTSVALGSR